MGLYQVKNAVRPKLTKKDERYLLLTEKSVRDWTLQEDVTLFKLVAANIKQNLTVPNDAWKCIAAHLARTDIQCSERYKNLDSLLKKDLSMGTKRKHEDDTSQPPNESIEQGHYDFQRVELVQSPKCPKTDTEESDIEEKEDDSDYEEKKSQETQQSSQETNSESQESKDESQEGLYYHLKGSKQRPAIDVLYDSDYYVDLDEIKLSSEEEDDSEEESELDVNNVLFDNQKVLKKIFQTVPLGEMTIFCK